MSSTSPLIKSIVTAFIPITLRACGLSPQKEEEEDEEDDEKRSSAGSPLALQTGHSHVSSTLSLWISSSPSHLSFSSVPASDNSLLHLQPNINFNQREQFAHLYLIESGIQKGSRNFLRLCPANLMKHFRLGAFGWSNRTVGVTKYLQKIQVTKELSSINNSPT